MDKYPDEMPIRVLDRPLNHTIRVPGSKSITNRALVLAALDGSECTLIGAACCDDTQIMIESLIGLGFYVGVNWRNERIVVGPVRGGRLIPASTADLNLGNSGTSMRFLAACVATGSGEYRLDGDARMRERPMQDLLDALIELGVDARSERGNGCPPILIRSNGLRGGTLRVRADRSSQFLSALLLVGYYAKNCITILVDGDIVSEPYVTMSVNMVQEWDINLHQQGNEYHFYEMISRGEYPVRNYDIEPDASAASYYFAAAAIAGGSASVPGMKQDMLQGDVRFVDVLKRMGCSVEYQQDAICITFDASSRILAGVDVDMNAISDTVMTLAAVACFADTPTTIRNVAHIRHKESDRISALTTELRKLGVEVEEYPDGLKITPRPMKGCVLETYNDHRLAMSFALIGLKVPGVVIRNPGCVAKTYPDFWKDFEKLYISAS